MRIRTTATVALCLGMAGCVGPTQPGDFVHGTVLYPSGKAVERALVIVEGGDQTFTDAAGAYRLPLPASGAVITVRARDGYSPGRAYAVTRSGSVEVRRQPGIVADIVLECETPI